MSKVIQGYILFLYNKKGPKAVKRSDTLGEMSPHFCAA